MAEVFQIIIKCCFFFVRSTHIRAFLSFHRQRTQVNKKGFEPNENKNMVKNGKPMHSNESKLD